jgi:G3E family GTPase
MEVSGGCFCCSFDEFMRKVNALALTEMPDIILAEPVGSCTDLVATIFRPFQLRHAESFSLAPLTVVVDPLRGLKSMTDTSRFPSEINYLFGKQLEEADVILINKIDKYPAEDIERLRAHLSEKYSAVVHCASARDERTLLPLLPVLGAEAQPGELMALDYETYGLAESFLGWFNGTCMLSGGGDARAFVADFFEGVRRFVRAQGSDIAHLKAHLITSGGHLKASLTSVEDDIEYDAENFTYTGSASMVINARVSMAPEALQPAVGRALLNTAKAQGLICGEYRSDCFKPGMPDASARKRS